MRRFLPFVLVLLVGCAAPWARGTPMERETGESLRAVERQHHRVALLYDAGCTQDRIPTAQCTAWRTFSDRFQVTYPLALRSWVDAERVGDTATSKEARATIVGLRDEISSHATRALEGIEGAAQKKR
jgi:hypothetical protein